MIEYLKGYLDRDWHTKDQIIYFLTKVCKLDTNERSIERKIRQYFVEFNERYESGQTEMFIAHSNRGYLLTSDQKIILESLEDDNKRALKLMRRYYRCKKALAEKDQLSLSPQETNLYEIVSRMI